MCWGPSTGHDVPIEVAYCTDNISSHFLLLSLSQRSYLSSVGCISESTYLILICCHKLRNIGKRHTHKDKDKCRQSFQPWTPPKKTQMHVRARTYIYSWISLYYDTVAMHCFATFYMCTISYSILSSTLSPLHPGLSLNSLTCWLRVCYSN